MFHFSSNVIPLYEKLEIGILLAIVGGFLDAYTYVCWGGVFANAQTGNMVLLGISAIQGNLLHSLYYLVPILSFSLGLLLTDFLLKNLSGFFFIFVLVTEIVILCFTALIPADSPNFIASSLISLMCSIQLGSFRKICGAPYTSTMCTGNLRSAMGCLFNFLTEKDRKALTLCWRYLAIILFFCIGAAIGALASAHWGNKAVLLCCILLLVLLILMVRDIIILKTKQKNLEHYMTQKPGKSERLGD